MSLLGLALVLAVGPAGPLPAISRRARIPVAVGRSSSVCWPVGWLDAGEPILTFLATVGFALAMFEVGSHVPLGDASLRGALGRGGVLAAFVGVLAVPAGFGVAALVGTGHAVLYAVLLASGSAALVVPTVTGSGVRTPAALATVVQVAVADTVRIVALPLAADPGRTGPAVIGAGAVGFPVMRRLRARGVLAAAHKVSKRRNFGVELRIQLTILFGLAGLAQLVGVSVMLAGFVAGSALTAQGRARRLARQSFAVTDGFLAPVFFVWLGASLDLRALVDQPRMIALTAVLALGAVVVHAAARLVGQPLSLAVLAGAQLGVPVAAVASGTTNHLLAPGEGAAMLVSFAVSALSTPKTPSPPDSAH
jgi:Kef-type K+ transport system membrane component KefB